jgi:hypothetical protein
MRSWTILQPLYGAREAAQPVTFGNGRGCLDWIGNAENESRASLGAPLPFSFGPVKVPPVMGMTVLVPLGPAPTLMAEPSVTFEVYRYVSVGAVAACAAATADRARRRAVLKICMSASYTSF